MLRWLVLIVVSAAAIGGGLLVVAGRGAPPSISIEKPERAVGQDGSREVTIGEPGGRLTELTMTLELEGRVLPLFSLDTPEAAVITQADPDHLRVSRALGKRSLPDLQAGAARIAVSASRASFLDLRMLSSSAFKDIQIRLDPPRGDVPLTVEI